jgi:hypothetical protein
VAEIGMIRIAYKVLVRKSKGKSPVEIFRHGWGDSIKMDVKETGWEYGLDSCCSG